MSDDSGARVERAIAGDPDALRGLLEELGPTVANEIRSQIGRSMRSALDADDVMQVTYIEAFLQISSVNARDTVGLLAWLRRLARNNLLDAMRGLQRRKRPPPALRVEPRSGDESYRALFELLSADASTPSRQVAGVEMCSILRAALDQLPPDYAAVVRQYDLEGRDMADVCKSLNRSAGAVHMLRARAHDRLRVILGGESRFFSEA